MRKRLVILAATLLALTLCACTAKRENASGIMNMDGGTAVSPQKAQTGAQVPETQPVEASQQTPAPAEERPGGNRLQASGAPAGEQPGGDRRTAVEGAGEDGGRTARGRSADADVIGRVERIIGNEAVLALGTMEDGSNTLLESGETATYLLPVGMPIGTGDFSSVTEGMVLGLSINEEGAITAVSILSR